MKNAANMLSDVMKSGSVQVCQHLLLYFHYKYLPFSFEGVKSIGQFRGIYRILSLEYLYKNQQR
jgi:hypothetical protein